MSWFKFISVLGLCAMMVGCGSNRKEKMYEEGVSWELAEHRKATIHDLKYDLAFSIPDKKSDAVEAEAYIRFRLDKVDEVIIDFRQSEQAIKSVEMNGKEVDYKVYNEHIIIPQSASLKGENVVYISYTADDQSLNRNDEYLYTLLVPDRARTLFPCFDQPNMKAEFLLNLDIPAEWVAVASAAMREEQTEQDRKLVKFEPTEPLSTYLFSFVAGKFTKSTYQDEKRVLNAYHRETDPKRTAQLGLIFDQVVYSLEWLEEYTAMPYPFKKYDFIILPGFQYGGMEHTGATLYNDNQMFLSEYPTPDEELSRAALIAHETAHMWYGGCVTMDWFNDVWTKEVYASFYAALITEPMFPEINHQLNWLKTTTTASLAEDRTLGSTSIRQDLDNLRNAGLIYGNIIYNKAPIMMQKLVEIMGEEAFRDGIREYLKTYAYSNATWDDLVRILDARCDEDLLSFSDVWVNKVGMPNITFTRSGDKLEVRQADPMQRGLLWPQSFNVDLVTASEAKSVTVDMTNDEVVIIELPADFEYFIPNSDGRGYGYFMLDKEQREKMMQIWSGVADDTMRQSLLLTLYENYQQKQIAEGEWLEFLIGALQSEHNALIASTLCGYLREPMRLTQDASSEKKLMALAESHHLKSCQVQLLRTLITSSFSEEVTAELYDMWKSGNHPLLNESDYMTMAYELALRMPDKYQQIITTQRARISNPDRLRQFDFISRAVTPDEEALDALFESLLEPENRRIEPWTKATLSYLNHPLRISRAVKYIRPALDEVMEVQRTGDIFFPRGWAGALLGSHQSEEAHAELMRFLEDNPDYPVLLRNKIMQAAWPLTRANR